MLDEIRAMLPDGWEIHDPDMFLEFLLECPCGNVIEQDGTCQEGCESPLRAAGLI